MRSLRCLLGRHRFTEWITVDKHLERECLRCCEVEVKYPDPVVMLAEIATDLLWKYYLWNTSPKVLIPPSKGAFRRIPDEHR